MENRLYAVLKERFFEEMNASIQRHPTYAKDVKAYHRLHMAKERPQVGVVLMSTSAQRQVLSADDFIGTLKSHVNLVKAGNAPGTSIEWVWEDSVALTQYVKEDVSATLTSGNRLVNVSHTPIVAGNNNLQVANNFGQIEVQVNGTTIIASVVDGASGKIGLPFAVSPTDVITVGYYYNNMDKPGFYYTEMLTENTFSMTPLYSVTNEVVIQKTTGIETTAQLANSPVLIDYVLSLTTQVQSNSTLIYLDRDIEYTVQADGTITFLQPLQKGTTLYATYRYQGANRGPFTIDSQYAFNKDAIRGVSLSFGSRMIPGDKQVVVLTDTREVVASVYGGHYNMTMEWKVFSRDPQTTAELADHIVLDIWGNRKEPLRFEGLTITAMDASGESEEAYDDSTQQMYFQTSITMEVMTEWKKFVPYVIKLNRYKFNIRRMEEAQQSVLDGVNQNIVVDVDMWVDPTPFTVTYPKTAFPVYF